MAKTRSVKIQPVVESLDFPTDIEQAVATNFAAYQEISSDGTALANVVITDDDELVVTNLGEIIIQE